jgi:hypothetical protein
MFELLLHNPLSPACTKCNTALYTENLFLQVFHFTGMQTKLVIMNLLNTYNNSPYIYL